ncbi:MAG TPA: MauE/DoxX family redox-associated membrane protein [Candidatus Krumholzibacteria bacterium]|nr:MauE/DoxX family redox-associated membrane protein [Candidatus Krumholzibacteria bacterium]
MMRWLALGCRLAVGAVFLAACWDKLLHPQAFAEAVHHYRLVPYALLHPFAHLLPVLEAVVGVALVLGVLRRGAALLAGGLTLVFIAAIASALARGLDISCGCFDTDGGHAVGLSLLVRDALLLAACVPPLLARDAGPALERLWRR